MIIRKENVTMGVGRVTLLKIIRKKILVGGIIRAKETTKPSLSGRQVVASKDLKNIGMHSKISVSKAICSSTIS